MFKKNNNNVTVENVSKVPLLNTRTEIESRHMYHVVSWELPHSEADNPVSSLYLPYFDLCLCIVNFLLSYFKPGKLMSQNISK